MRKVPLSYPRCVTVRIVGRSPSLPEQDMVISLFLCRAEIIVAQPARILFLKEECIGVVCLYVEYDNKQNKQTKETRKKLCGSKVDTETKCFGETYDAVVASFKQHAKIGRVLLSYHSDPNLGEIFTDVVLYDSHRRMVFTQDKVDRDLIAVINVEFGGRHVW